MKNYTTGQLARMLSRELRSNPTDAEKTLWTALKNRQFLNLKFLRQHPIYYLYNNKKSFFIADFYCHEIKMVVELDGRIHVKHKDYDQIRTEILDFKDIQVVRYKNEEITKDIAVALKRLKITITKRKADIG
ncbi:MAG: endonuclease domain-containing protein [Calditrichia bacterium]|nr:endonuclease domain-containing protein [Calditrichia bacterium]